MNGSEPLRTLLIKCKMEKQSYAAFPDVPTTSRLAREMLAMSLKVLRRSAVEEKVGLKKSSIYQLMQDGLFPHPIPLAGSKSVGWLEDEIDAWLRARIALRDAMSTPDAVKRKRGRPRKVHVEARPTVS